MVLVCFGLLKASACHENEKNEASKRPKTKIPKLVPTWEKFW